MPIPALCWFLQQGGRSTTQPQACTQAHLGFAIEASGRQNRRLDFQNNSGPSIRLAGYSMAG
jgi:hypothetical protein